MTLEFKATYHELTDDFMKTIPSNFKIVSGGVLGGLAKRSDLPEPYRNKIVDFLADKEMNDYRPAIIDHIKSSILSNPNLTAHEIDRILVHRTPSFIISDAILHPNIKTDTIIKHLHYLSTLEQHRIACKSDRPDLLRHIANNENWRHRACVVSNDHTPIDVLHKLKDDPNPFVASDAKHELSLREKS